MNRWLLFLLVVVVCSSSGFADVELEYDDPVSPSGPVAEYLVIITMYDAEGRAVSGTLRKANGELIAHLTRQFTGLAPRFLVKETTTDPAGKVIREAEYYLHKLHRKEKYIEKFLCIDKWGNIMRDKSGQVKLTTFFGRQRAVGEVTYKDGRPHRWDAVTYPCTNCHLSGVPGIAFVW
jgi:hypothetical protein